MQLLIDEQGKVQCLYTEAFDLASLGALTIGRASQVEPDTKGRWWAEIEGGPRLGPFALRSLAIAAEVDWLETHRLGGTAR